jgi:hypothetical protein
MIAAGCAYLTVVPSILKASVYFSSKTLDIDKSETMISSFMSMRIFSGLRSICGMCSLSNVSKHSMI